MNDTTPADRENTVTVEEVIHDKATRLGLALRAGEDGLSRTLTMWPAQSAEIRATGYLEVHEITPFLIIGPETLAALAANDHERQQLLSRQFASGSLAAVFVSDDLDVPGWLLDKGNQHRVCIYSSAISHSMLYERLQHRAVRKLLRKTSLHGVFLSVRNVGTLIQGPSGIGKSEVALDLINRGHRLIADDVVRIYRSSPYKISGYCPELLRGHLEIRGLGILDIADIFGYTAIMDSMPVDLIVQLEYDEAGRGPIPDRLNPLIRNRDILETSVPEITIRVAPGRNIAILIEAAVRTHIQYQFGKDPVQAFVDKQQNLLNRRKTLVEPK